MKLFLLMLGLLMMTFISEGCAGGKPVVVIETSEGNIELELFPEVAPKHVANFLKLIREGFYKDMIFHRVIDGFMIQTGDPTGLGSGGSKDRVPLEVSDSLHHAGSLGMARTNDPNSATSQFYICLVPTTFLDKQYTVFGRTIKGFDIVQKIGKVPTSGNGQRIMQDSTWRAELLRLKAEGKADVYAQNGYPMPDRPLKTVKLIRIYEKK